MSARAQTRSARFVVLAVLLATVPAVSPATASGVAAKAAQPRFALEVRSVGTPAHGNATGSEPLSAVVGDFTGDGRRDVAVATGFMLDPEDDAKVFVFPQLSDGRMGAARKVSSGCTTDLGVSRRRGMAAGDVNRDGRADLVLAGECGVDVFLQRDGVLRLSTTLRTRAVPHFVKVADFDADGRRDVVVALRSMPEGAGQPYVPGGLLLLRNTASGWQRVALSTRGILPDGIQGLDVADVTGDRRPDIVLAQSSGDGTANALVHVLRNTRGGFQRQSYRLTGEVWSTPGGLSTGDLTGDGRADVVVTVEANRTTSRVNVLRQAADGTLAPGEIHGTYDLPRGVQVADINSDGRRDIVMLHSGWQYAGLLLQEADRSLSDLEYLWGVPYDSRMGQETLAVADVTGDGRRAPGHPVRQSQLRPGPASPDPDLSVVFPAASPSSRLASGSTATVRVTDRPRSLARPEQC